MKSATHTKRILVISSFMWIAIIALVARLVYIFGPWSTWLSTRALVQHAQGIPMELPRGQITDRNGIPLTGTSSEENLIIFPTMIPKDRRLTVALELSQILDMEYSKVRKVLDGGTPVVLARRLQVGVKNAIIRQQYPGVLVVAQRLRYQSGNPVCHVVGYSRTIDNKGVSGIEGAFDKYLRTGSARTLSVMVDAKGHLIPGLGLKVQKPSNIDSGSHVKLTIDEVIQSKLEQAMSSVIKGAAIAMDPRTGDILAMVSKPTFDPNYITPSLTDSRLPLVNRAISAFYPGSIFKLVTAAAALESGVVADNEIFHDPGYAQVTPSRRVRCSKTTGHGDITFLKAISLSCNTVFIEVASRLGVKPIVEMAQKLGFGGLSGIQLPEEKRGELPDVANITPLGLANVALGQQGVMATPLQTTVLMSTIVNDGLVVRPRLVLEATNAEGRIVDGVDKQTDPEQVMTSKTARLLRLALEDAVMEGTGKQARVPWGGCAGKTGTAQTGRRDASGNPISHAWFVGYAPVLEPSIVATIMVEDGGNGGEVAAPVFRTFIESLPAVGR